MQVTKGKVLNRQLLNHRFRCDDAFMLRYNEAKIAARHLCAAENAIAVLSNMPLQTSYICYGHLGAKLGLGNGTEELPSIWEYAIMDRICSDDLADKIAWELQFNMFTNQLPSATKSDYYLQHLIRMTDARGEAFTIRHRIYYLDYDAEGNVLLSLCLYSVAVQNQGVTGIIHSLEDTLVGKSSIDIQGLLSVRERQILSLISSGKASKQIAVALNISTNTVNNHRQNIIRKLHCHNTAEAIQVAGKLGLLSPK